MKKISYLLLFLSICQLGFGQNLIPNPGFDDLTGCPNGANQLDLAYPWKSIQQSPDLFNKCSDNPNIRVPKASVSHLDGYQYPVSGDGFAGLLVYLSDNFGDNEYMESPLSQPMEKGQTYYLQFFVSPDMPSSVGENWIYTDAVGLALSDTSLCDNNIDNPVFPLTPVIENLGTLITDTLGWTKISGCYQAKGGERYAVIGNFRPNNEVMAEVGNPDIWPYKNYFYIEDVLIMAFDPLPDTLLLCEGMPETLNAGFLEAEYEWSTGETDSVIVVSEPGQYVVSAYIDDCILRDTVLVLDTRNPDLFQSDTVICEGVSVILESPLPGVYEWSDGSREDTLEVQSSGFYELKVMNECGEFFFSTEVETMVCDCDIYVPTAFSPNGDGVNDILEVFWGCDFSYKVNRFAVYDRWGGELFSASEEGIFWNGEVGGKPMSSGVYIWYLDYEIIKDGAIKKHIEKGEVVLVR